MRDLFLLDPDITFLNHGSFGACPQPVFAAYQHWQAELERQPVAFLGRRAAALLDAARAALGAYLLADPDDLIFVPNATTGVNIVARSLDLQPGDEVLATDHEYGAVDFTWQHVCQQAGAHYIRQPIDPNADFVAQLWAGVTPRTRVIAISHITSPTALIFPVAEVCKRAREAGLLTVIDGAHAPGQIPLDLTAIGADFYTGNCHKWLCAPKGSAFLHVDPAQQARLEPLVISWGFHAETFAARHQWQGTRDIAAFLSVPAAIAFQVQYDWEAVRERCHALAVETRRRIGDATSLPQIAPEDAFAQMFTVPLPPGDPDDLKGRLYDEHRVEVPVIVWRDAPYLRVSFQGYNSVRDADALLAALSAVGVY